MKRLNLLLLSILSLPAMTGCGSGSSKDHYVRPLVDDSVFDVEIPTFDTPILNIEVLNVPKYAIEVGYLSYMGIELGIKYTDESEVTIPLTERLFPLDQLETLKTPGKKYIDFLLQGNHISFDITLKEAAVPIYHEVKFTDYNNSLLYKQKFGYLEPAIYNGDEIPGYREGDYYYVFNNKWSVSTEFVYRDFTTKAQYNQEDVRNFGNKTTELIKLTAEDGVTYSYRTLHRLAITREGDYTYNPKALFYLGEVKGFEVAHSEEIYHVEGNYDKAEGAFDDIEELDLVDPLINMAKSVYRVGDKEETGVYNDGFIRNGYKLVIDTSLNSEGKPKGIIGEIDPAYGKIPNWQRTDRRIVSHEPILKPEIAADVKSMMKSVSMPIYTGYPTGYYRVSYVVNLDLLLDVYFNSSTSTMIKQYSVNTPKLVPCFDYSSCHAVLSYSESGRFDEVHNNTIEIDIDEIRSLLLPE